MARDYKDGNSDSSIIKSILRALLVLEQFNSTTEIGIKELSMNTGLPASTVQRIVNTLELKNYLVQNPKNEKYRLGIAMYFISRNYAESFDWVEEAVVHMKKMVDKHKENVNLGVLQGQKIAFLTKVESPHILRPNFPVGIQYPAVCTALGKCLLAYQNTEILDKLLSTKIEACTKNTITDPEKLLAEFSKIRKNGYAMEDEEFQKELFCIAAPIKGYKNAVVAAISISIPKYRLDTEKIPEMIEDLVKTANNISADLTDIYNN